MPALAMILAACGDHLPPAPELRVADPVAAVQASQSLVVTPANDTILIGQSVELRVTNPNGSAINKRAAWTSSNPSIATVTSTGTATGRVTGLEMGIVTITAASGQKTGTTSVTVIPVPVRSVTLDPDSATLELGDSVQFIATPRDSAGGVLGNRPTAWSVLDGGIVDVSSTGLVVARAPGTARVVATVEGVADTSSVTVVQIPARVALSEMTLVFSALGDTMRLVATVYDRTGNVVAGAPVVWASADTTVATVDANGLVTPRSRVGGYTWTLITASSGVFADTATVAVYRHATRVVVSPDTLVVNELSPMGSHSGKQITALVYDRNGYFIEGGLWGLVSLDPSIALVTDSGFVVAMGYGQARVVASTNGGVSDTAVVIVEQPATEPVASAALPMRKRGWRELRQRVALIAGKPHRER